MNRQSCYSCVTYLDHQFFDGRLLFDQQTRFELAQLNAFTMKSQICRLMAQALLALHKYPSLGALDQIIGAINSIVAPKDSK